MKCENKKDGKMFKLKILTTLRHLEDLYNLLNDHDELPQWCQDKLAKCEGNITSLSNYLISKNQKKQIDNSTCNESNDDKLKEYIKETIKKKI